jgi:hypothetical protein
MFFNKKPEQVLPATVEETLEWPMPRRRSQSFRIIVSSWFMKTTPMLKYQGGYKAELTFEGTARIGTTPNFPVYGEIEIPIDLDPPGYLTDGWENIPECVDGHASLHLDGAPQLFLTLFCTKEAMESVARVLAAGFSVAKGKAALDLDITYPDEMGPDFWKETWQQKTLRVAKWDARASGGESRNANRLSRLN